jgi:lipopolysaccharide biosynthesis glycosyltransferase
VTWHVACAADERYVGHCAAMLHSLLERARAASSREVVVHFLHAPTFPTPTRDQLAAFVATNGGRFTPWEIADDRVAGLPTMDRIPRTMWYRIFLPELLPDVERVLYLDADTLVVDDLAPLFDRPLDGAYVAAVPNVFEPRFAQRPQELALPRAQPYFNSGVLLFDLARMRDDGCTQQIVRMAKNEPLLWPDQDALNVVLGGRQVTLHPRWNAMNSLFLLREAQATFGAETVRDACARPAIVHFEGPALSKPWHYLNKHPYRAEYLRHRRATPWPDVAVEGRTWSNRLLRPLPTRAAMEVLGRWQWARAKAGGLRGRMRGRLRLRGAR